jgi:hypothetical protein
MTFLPVWYGRTRNDACGLRAMRYADVEKEHEALIMPRDGSLTPADLIGKLEVLRVECEKCGRSGRYRVATRS